MGRQKNTTQSDETAHLESESKAQTQKRFYQGDREMDHDLFRLNVANMVKNVGVDAPDQEPTIVEMAHTHFFHTVDSDGRPQTHSVYIGGHCHKMTVLPASEPGEVPTVICGPAVREVRKKHRGKFIKVWENLPDDTHSHEVQYIRSDKIRLRTANAEAANVIAVEAQKTAPIPGIQG